MVSSYILIAIVKLIFAIKVVKFALLLIFMKRKHDFVLTYSNCFFISFFFSFFGQFSPDNSSKIVGQCHINKSIWCSIIFCLDWSVTSWRCEKSMTTCWIDHVQKIIFLRSQEWVKVVKHTPMGNSEDFSQSIPL